MGAGSGATLDGEKPTRETGGLTDSQGNASDGEFQPVGAGDSKSELTGNPNGPDLAEAIVAAVATKLSEEQKSSLVQELSISRSFSGPLPPPDDFERYNKVAPDAANRILAMAEKEQQIRADGQSGAIRNDGRRINGAIAMGIALIGVAGLATWLGSAIIALPLGLVGAVAAIIRHLLDVAERQRQKDRS